MSIYGEIELSATMIKRCATAIPKGSPIAVTDQAEFGHHVLGAATMAIKVGPSPSKQTFIGQAGIAQAGDRNRRRSPHSISIGGFRTPAAGVRRTAVRGRHPTRWRVQVHRGLPAIRKPVRTEPGSEAAPQRCRGEPVSPYS